MGKKLHLCVVTQEDTVFDGETGYVNLPTADGSIGILPGHAAMLCAVAEGVIRCGLKEDNGVQIATGAGIAEVNGDQITVLVAQAHVNE